MPYNNAMFDPELVPFVLAYLSKYNLFQETPSSKDNSPLGKNNSS